MSSSTIPLRDAARPSGPPLPDMTPAATLALLARCLHAEGYDEHISGHMSWRQPDGTFLVDPRGVRWADMTAADIVTMDPGGEIVAGPWGITPALRLHLEIHRRRRDVGVIVHHHSRFGTVWSSARRIPPVYDQTSALLEGGLVLYGRYDGSVGLSEAASLAADALGDAGCALLGHHGVLVTGRDPSHAFQRAALLEWRCRLAWHVEALGGPAEPMPQDQVDDLSGLYAGKHYPELFEAMARGIMRGEGASQLMGSR